MPDGYLGRAQFFKIGPAAANLTEISGDASGLSTVELSEEVASRVIPGQGTSVARQSTGVSDNGITFEVDANATTWPLLHRKSGATVFFEYGPRGNGAGMPKYTGEFLAQVSEPAPYDDVIRFSVTGEINGEVDEGVY